MSTESLTRLETHPSEYRHWKLDVKGPIARLTMDVKPDGGLRQDYELKLNSYDLGVDVELSDAIQRLRFEHPEVRALIVDSALDRVFCAGANIPMLSSSSHAFKVNFCKYTNETRLYLEGSEFKSLAALNGTCAGGGYELALACDKILLIDDGSSAVSLPEVPLLAVLPGTGGLTRVVDKRAIRRDLADIFCTTSEGVRGKRAVDWKLVDGIAPRSKFEAEVERLSEELVQASPRNASGAGVELPPVGVKRSEDGSFAYEFVHLAIDEGQRVATLSMHAPKSVPASAEALVEEGAGGWCMRAFRELDHALLRLRFDFPEVGLILLKSAGDAANVLANDALLAEAAKTHWFASEVVSLQERVLRRLDVTSRSFFAIIDEGSCFAGSLFELALAADRAYMLEDDDEAVTIQLGAANGTTEGGPLTMWNGLTRFQTHFFGHDDDLAAALNAGGAIAASDAEKLGLITVAADDIDWEDDVRIAIEERASLSPDALTGMEASLRFPGPETIATKIFARLSAWQNWIFQRPNAVGPGGALTKYGEPDRPVFDWKRC